MNGKTFVRTFVFALYYGHGWASALASNVACADSVTGAFAKAWVRRINTSDKTLRLTTEVEMFNLAGTFEQQKALIEAADRLLAEEEREIAGITAEDSFSEKRGTLHYDHVTGSGRLEVWVHDERVEFSISRPEERNLFCVSLNLTNGNLRVYSGDYDSFLAEDHDSCMRRWVEHLRLRHIWAIEDAVQMFFCINSDCDLRCDVLNAIYTEASAVFHKQEDSAELSYWHYGKEKHCNIVLKPNNPYVSINGDSIPLSDAVRIPLFQELQRIDACAPETPALIPFDYKPSSPDAQFFLKCFGLPKEGVRYEDMHGTFMVDGNGFTRYSERACCITLFFATGVTPSDVKRHTTKYKTEKYPPAALLAGLKDAVVEREGKGTFLFEQNNIMLRLNYPKRSLADLNLG